MKPDDVIAILIADIHLSHNPPAARAETQTEWYDYMGESLGELSELQVKYNVPVLIAGDIFDKWDSPAELINFAIDRFPSNVMAIPGQHDLPHHELGEMDRSAYGTLCRSNVRGFDNLTYPTALCDGWEVVPFPWGVALASLGEIDEITNSKTIALAHHCVWSATSGTGYKGAPEGGEWKRVRKSLAGFDVAVFGDNHKALTDSHVAVGPRIYNCGFFMPRNVKEKGIQPVAGLLRRDGYIGHHKLQTYKQAKWVEIEDEAAPEEYDQDMADMLDKLEGQDDQRIDFREALERAIDSGIDLLEKTKPILLEALDDGDKR